MYRHGVHKIVVLIIVLFTISIVDTFGQRWKLRRYQVGFGIGTAQIFGDIGGTADKENWFGLKDIQFDETRMVFGGFVRYKFNTRFSGKVNFNMGLGCGQDEGSRNDRGRSYQARLIEFSGQAEYYFFTEDPRYKSAAMFNRQGMINNYASISAYAFLGLGVTYSMLKHEYGVVTPVDDYKSSNIAPVFPFGIGIKYLVDEKWYINAELGYRWSISDYIEGYKQTQESKHYDVYYFLLISASYRIKTTRRGIPAFLDKKNKKYRF